MASKLFFQSNWENNIVWAYVTDKKLTAYCCWFDSHQPWVIIFFYSEYTSEQVVITTGKEKGIIF